ncbi:hypothetical protein IV203_030283 [Nitzschia inconspicua]|uniref:Uncharacterized protein n=1 Tax=Nitzschia inconspicua TaxID=303405 RepID=A0A9K3LT10_9STRA|nr:hypothetical protein IV203_030283 [Nitzschia inconspicua]
MQRPISYFTHRESFGSHHHNKRDSSDMMNPVDIISFSYPNKFGSTRENNPTFFGATDEDSMEFATGTPNADELSSYSSQPNSVEASWNGSSYPYRSEAHHNSDQQRSFLRNNHRLSQRHVLTPPSPSREHVPKRPRFGVDGLNVVESLIHSIFSSCGCVQTGNATQHQYYNNSNNSQRQQRRQFASKPLGFKGSSPNDRPHYGHASQFHHPDWDSVTTHSPWNDGLVCQQQQTTTTKIGFAAGTLSDPPKVRRLTMQDASNDLDITFLM